MLLTTEDNRDNCEPLYVSLSDGSKVCLLMLSSNRCHTYLCCYLLKIIKTPMKLYHSLSEDSKLYLSMLSAEDSRQCSTYLLMLLSTEDSRENCEPLYGSLSEGSRYIY